MQKEIEHRHNRLRPAPSIDVGGKKFTSQHRDVKCKHEAAGRVTFFDQKSPEGRQDDLTQSPKGRHAAFESDI